MKIEAFEYIKSATRELNGLRTKLERAALKLKEYFIEIFGHRDESFSFSHRIKTGASLREKILRNELYKKIEVDKLFDNLSDIIGIRIGCRFLKDEKDIFERLKNHFFMENGDGCMYHPGNKNICLKLSSPQPERQQNGFDIYRIDGYIIYGGVKFRFELQIKSLINTFWSEIEHKIIYKNKRFLGSDNFIGELMKLIYANLESIDTQLNMLFNRSEDRSNTEFFKQTENIIAIMLDEISSELVEYKTGIAVNLNDYSERLVKYLLGSNIDPGDDNFNKTVSRIISKLKSEEFMQIPIGEKIEFDAPVFEDELHSLLGEKIYSEINADFYVNTFFHILFFMQSERRKAFSRFIQYLYGLFKTEFYFSGEEIKHFINTASASRIISAKN